MNKKQLILLLAFFPLLAIGQQKYPYEVLPGQTKTVSPAQDTLWVLKHSQLQRALIFGKENKLLKEEVKVLKEKLNTRKGINVECDSLVALHKKDALFYKENWEESDKDLKTVARKYKRQKLYKNISMGGAVVAFFAGFFLAL